MTLLTLYIARQLVIGFALLAFVLGALFGIFSFVVEADYVGDGQYETLDALLVVAMQTPALVTDLAPFIAMLGTIYGISGLVRSSELIALSNAGVSNARIVGACALIVMALALLFALVEVGARPLHQRASLYRMFQIAMDGTPLPDSGYWIARDDVYANIRAWGGDGPRDIEVFEFAEGRRLKKYTAARAAEIVGPDEWRLMEVKTTRFDSAETSSDSAGELLWTPIWSASTDLYDLPLESKSLGEIRRQVPRFAEGSREAAVYSFEFFRRWCLVLTATGFTVFAASFVLSHGPRGGHGAQLALGAFAAILVYLAQQIGTNAALLAGVPPLAVALLPGLLVGALGFYLIHRLQRV